MNEFADSLPLGKPTRYKSEYDPGLLCPIPRKLKRDEIGLPDELPFHGVDIWNAYELSWLTSQGKPVVAINTATYWHALRAVGITDRKAGFGSLMEHH